jgi:hypothetical protein
MSEIVGRSRALRGRTDGGKADRSGAVEQLSPPLMDGGRSHVVEQVHGSQDEVGRHRSRAARIER